MYIVYDSIARNCEKMYSRYFLNFIFLNKFFGKFRPKGIKVAVL